MQDFGRTPATALRMSMVTRAAGFAGLSPPSLSLLDITSTRVILSPPPYKIIFYTRFYRFSATEEGNSSILENFGAELLRKFVFDETLSQLLHSRDECVAIHGRGPFSNDLSFIARDRTLVKSKRNS